MFITFEGGEGAGKSTLIRNLSRELERQGIALVTTREPGGCPLADQIRSLVLENKGEGCAIGVEAELLLFLAARAQHVEQLIKPALAEGKLVLCDRFNDSTIAYQGIARNVGQDLVEKLCTFASHGLEPDLTFFLDISAEEGLARSLKTEKKEAPKGMQDRMEGQGKVFHEKVRRGFELLAQKYPNRICVLDGRRSKEELTHQALDLITTRMGP